jgi:hypothetical protein
MYFQDLTGYSYSTRVPAARARNVGWLERGQWLPRGECDPRVRQNLLDCYALLTANRMRGTHVCSFCDDDEKDIFVVGVDGKAVMLGAAELWLPDGNGGAFVAPDLIIHYLETHSYLPPDEFIVAALRLPSSVTDWDAEAMSTMLTAP